MFGWFRKRSSSASDDIESLVDTDDDAAEKSDRITSPRRIDAILEDLRKHHLLLNVVVPGSNYPFVSSLLDIDDGQLLFDEFKPENGQQLVASKGRFKVEAVLRGIGISFMITDFSAEDSDGIVLYRAERPEEISYLQRRRNHRIPIPPSQQMTFHGDHFGEGVRLNGTVANLSRQGLAFLTRLSIPLQAGDELVNCAIGLPDGDTVRFSLHVCFVESMPWAKNSVIGARFAAITPKDQNKLAEYVVTLEREMIRSSHFGY